MKTSKWLHAVLRNDSGEWPARRQAQLSRQIAKDPALRTFVEDLDQAHRAHQILDVDPKPHPFVVDTILAEAQRVQHRPAPVRRAADWRLWKPALAYASLAIALLVAAHLFFASAGDPAMEVTRTESVPPAPSLVDPDAWDAAFEMEWIELNYELEMLLAAVVEYADDDEMNENDWALELLEWETSS